MEKRYKTMKTQWRKEMLGKYEEAKTVLDDAYRWLCQQRQHFPPNADVWHFRRQYSAIKSDLLEQINSVRY
jgi:hypothetical protein